MLHSRNIYSRAGTLIMIQGWVGGWISGAQSFAYGFGKLFLQRISILIRRWFIKVLETPTERHFTLNPCTCILFCSFVNAFQNSRLNQKTFFFLSSQRFSCDPNESISDCCGSQMVALKRKVLELSASRDVFFVKRSTVIRFGFRLKLLSYELFRPALNLFWFVPARERYLFFQLSENIL